MPPVHRQPPEQRGRHEGVTRQLPGDLRRQLGEVYAGRRQGVVSSDGAIWQNQHERRRYVLPGVLPGLDPEISVERLYAALERGAIMLRSKDFNPRGFLGILYHPSDTTRLAIAAHRVAQPIVYRLRVQQSLDESLTIAD